MKYSVNRENTARIVFESVTKLNDFKVKEFAPHKEEKCFCDCFTFSLTTIDEGKKLDEFLTAKNITYNKTQIHDMTEFIIESSSNKVRNCFNDLYRKSLPSIKEHSYLYKLNSPRKRVLIYKISDQERLEYKIIDNDLCKLTKEGTEISEALLISIHSIVCFVEGTGCRCSSIPAIKPTDLNPQFIIDIINKIETIQT